MNKPEADKRIAKLREEINRHNLLYYVEARQEISDYEYDALYRELQQLEEQFPALITPDSPTQRVGGQPLKEFKNVRHAIPMLSLEKTDKLDGLHTFDASVRKQLTGESVQYVLEPKVDGVSISVRYEDGMLALGATRGDGVTGDDITANIKTIRAIPIKLKTNSPPRVLEVRGEAYIPTKEFEKLNDRLSKAGEKTFPNARNATAGTLKQLDPRIAAGRPLSAVFYAVGEVDGVTFDTHAEALEALKRLGLPISRYWLCRDIAEILRHYENDVIAHGDESKDLRTRVPYELDGIVLKLNDLSQWKRIPAKSKTPGYAVVYKPEHWIKPAETRLLGITVQVGRTGVLTPVAELDPVFVQGSTVSRATLHNEDEIRRKDIRIGDAVIIRKAGMVIPEVVSVVTAKRPRGAKAFDLVEHVGGKCPACGGPISKQKVSAGQKDEVAWRCDNVAACPAQLVRRIEFLAQRSALDIEGLGGVVAEKLVERGLVNEPLDMFNLTVTQLAVLNLGTDEEPRILGEKNATRIVDALERARSMSLSRWLLAFGVPNVGETIAYQLAQWHEKLAALAESAILRDIVDLAEKEALRKDIAPRSRKNAPKDAEDLARRTGECETLGRDIESLKKSLQSVGADKEIGPVAARGVIEFFKADTGKRLIKRLRELKIEPKGGDATAGRHTAKPLAGKTFVLTGTMNVMTRDEASEAIRTRGGSVAGAVSKNTDFVVAGVEAGSKLDKAKELAIPVVDEKQFLEMIGVRATKTVVRQEDLFPERHKT